MKKIGYIVIREDLNDPLIESQVLDVLECVNKKNYDVSVCLIWFYRIDYFFKNKKEMKKIKTILSDRNISYLFLPFLSYRFPVDILLMPFVIPQWIIGLFISRLILKINIFHARSYNAGLLTYFFKKFFGCKYIFDPRSPYITENISSGVWKYRGINHKIWMQLDYRITLNSDCTIITASKMSVHAKLKYKYKIIPNNYPKLFDSFTEGYHPEKKYDLVYSGSFGHWNKLDPYIILLKKLNQILNRDVTMLFLSRSLSRNAIINAANSYGLNSELITVVNVNQHEVLKQLEGAKVGVYLISNIDSRLGVKTVEYLRAGLPLIVSKSLISITSMLNDNKLGVVLEDENSINEILKLIELDDSRRANEMQRLRNYSKDNFSTEVVSDLYLNIYIQLEY